MRAVFVTRKSSGDSCRAAVILPGASPHRRTARWRHARRRTSPAQAGELLSDAGSRLDTVEVQAFEEAFHGFICLTDELFQRETLATKRTAHEGLVAGTRDLQLVIAFRTGQCRLGLQNKTCFLPCVLRNAHDAAPYAGTDSGCQLFFFTQPLTRFSVKIKAQAVRLAMIYMLKIYLINSKH